MKVRFPFSFGFSFSLSLATVTAGAGILGATGALVTGSAACASSPDNKKFTEILMPDFPSYAANVDIYLQRRCGTLDCHGQPGRAYRIYGFTGFRLLDPDGGAQLVSGQQPTTQLEVRANYQAAIALEPEEMSKVVGAGGLDHNRLLLLRKPLRLERHKGGPAMAEDDAGFKCVVAWLKVKTVKPLPDGIDFETIPEEVREKLSPRSVLDCEEAASFP
jgi:hypothetical protein